MSKTITLSDDVLRIFDKHLDFETSKEIGRWFQIVNRLDDTIRIVELETTNIPEGMRNLKLLKLIRDGSKNTVHSNCTEGKLQ